MPNARKELLGAVNDIAKIKCALITYKSWDNKESKIVLKINHTNDEFNEFLNSLDFEYDNDYGSQELFGTVWLDNGTWMSRGEYDGSEWWKHNVLPTIPSECL
jgi:predicted HNH restriction endonuclease